MKTENTSEKYSKESINAEDLYSLENDKSYFAAIILNPCNVSALTSLRLKKSMNQIFLSITYSSEFTYFTADVPGIRIYMKF
eukprot:snap_masked-scaffold_17-processed-gene-6.58-mRNA-1 protein AED:1.00 eAED:1.00 QI:0/0/0/0/1/1/3/0/81